MLTFKDVTVTFGGLKAINQISLEVPENSIYSIIGPMEQENQLYLIVLVVFILRPAVTLRITAMIYYNIKVIN